MGDELQVVQGAYEAFGRGDIPAVLEVLDEDVDWSSPEVLPHGGDFRGRDEVGRFFQGLGEKWEDDFAVEVEDSVDGGDHVVMLGRASGTLRDGGTRADFGFAHVFDVRDGKVARFREFVDPDATLRGGG